MIDWYSHPYLRWNVPVHVKCEFEVLVRWTPRMTPALANQIRRIWLFGSYCVDSVLFGILQRIFVDSIHCLCFSTSPNIISINTLHYIPVLVTSDWLTPRANSFGLYLQYQAGTRIVSDEELSQARSSGNSCEAWLASGMNPHVLTVSIKIHRYIYLRCSTLLFVLQDDETTVPQSRA